ncbi:MAG: hypothetical protein NZM04_02760 [Methylacidiphilales bacterium]|nr:hypothetical protein [Candidatus Methylacidiphilales bacterium]MDW8348653.1 hypothetical protein [Verrucomicrobiae bacterium]
MKTLLSIALSLLTVTLVHADISMPKTDNFYDKAGRAVAGILLSPAHILDSHYSYLELEGTTVAGTKGIIQGFGRMFSDMAHGIFELITAPFAIGPNQTYGSYRMPPWNSMVVQDYPPADLKNWY